MNTTQAIFHRPQMAQALAQKLLRPNAFEVTVRDGLFITGIRRIGKTTFLRQDLIPELEKEGAIVIYADLWADVADRSPVKNVLRAIHTTLHGVQRSSYNLDRIKVSLPLISFSFDIDKIGNDNGVSIAEAFVELISKSNRNVVLIIDEIQQTLRSHGGKELLLALKAARDAVNLRPNNINGTYLLIVGTGSHRSFVTAMASRSSQPFYGADRIDYPMLGKDYIDWQINELLKLPSTDEKRIPSQKALIEGFGTLGCRPRSFLQVLTLLQEYPGKEVDLAFLSNCTNQARNDASETIQPIATQDRLTKLLFSEIAKAGKLGLDNLFSSDFLMRLRKELNQQLPVKVSTVQSKLNQMQRKDWIYPISYGCYAVSDPQVAAVWCANAQDYLQDPPA